MDPHSSSSSRTLRFLTVISWVPSFALLLAEGLYVHHILPALGILPMSFSACTGLLHLSRSARTRSANIVLDLFCASFLLAIFVPSCVALSDSDEWVPHGAVLLGALGMGGEILNMFIHVFFILSEVNWYNTFGLVFSKGTCPNCQCEYSQAGRGENGYVKISGNARKDEDEGSVWQGSVCPSSSAMVFSERAGTSETLSESG